MPGTCLLEFLFPSGPLENAADPTTVAPLLSCPCEGRATCDEQISRKGKGRSNHISEGTTTGIQVSALREAVSPTGEVAAAEMILLANSH